jgi:hypothetical protein
MNIGLLWYDGDPKAGLEEKVRRAAGRYRQKFGRAATVCFLNPRALADRPAGAALEVLVDNAPIKIVAERRILPDHFWVGISEE